MIAEGAAAPSGFHANQANRRLCDARGKAADGSGAAVPARASLRDNALLPHAPRQQGLAERIVDLMRAGVQQILALEIKARAAQRLGKPARVVKWGRPARVGVKEIVQLGSKSG